MPGIKIFGAFQDSRCILKKNHKGELVHWGRAAGFAENLKDIEEKIKEGLDNEDNKNGLDDKGDKKHSVRSKVTKSKVGDFGEVKWFAAHAPLLNAEVVEYLAPFEVASFGHTHGGIVPRGLDEIFDRLHLHFGLISPNMLPLPRRARGAMAISDSTMMVVNPGMVATQFCMPKILQNMNFVKAAEVSVVEIGPMENEESKTGEGAGGKDAGGGESKGTINKSKIRRARKTRKDKNAGSVESDLGEYF